ncbi:class I SAM-dependent methyltransferase [Desulfopila inferna]|uniref:class I SAM-dependent methyltransferase n=1 Tax=Desulfopila inferna TaxID=468528 RepID=UPI0019639055|nr:class I SAM-dependent methyltransferase [Desulfopila inferna]MBM9602716.1 class I SAM-dependent methyltransferase [Desulfopila inferna]
MQKIEIYTTGKYLQDNPTWHEEDSYWKSGNIFNMMQENELMPQTVCEVGCGAGEILRQLSFKLPDVQFFGFEISPQAYELAQQKQNERVQFFLEDFSQNNEQYYDILLAIDVFEHIEDYYGFLRKVRERAAYKIFHIPLDISVQRVLLSKPIMKRRREVGHIHYFTKETALATLEDTGYTIVDYSYTASTLDLPAPSLLYSLGKIPLKIAGLLNKDLAARILGGYSLMVLAK